MHTCAFTGHRPDGFKFGYDEDSPLCAALKFALQREIENAYEMGGSGFLTGCALGVDMWAGEAVLNMRRKRTDIRLVGVVPFKGQENRWGPQQKERYNALLKNADEVITVCGNFSRSAYLTRDRYMADRADMLIAVYDRSRSGSGTGYTVRYALKLDRPVVIIEPDTLDVSRMNFKD